MLTPLVNISLTSRARNGVIRVAKKSKKGKKGKKNK
jgi:hypothetical protein